MSTTATTWLWCSVIVLLVVDLMVVPVLREIRRERARKLSRLTTQSDLTKAETNTEPGD